MLSFLIIYTDISKYHFQVVMCVLVNIFLLFSSAFLS